MIRLDTSILPEVSRSLAACEGAILVVDAAQGLKPKLLANVYLTLDNDLKFYPSLIKLACLQQIRTVRTEVEDVIGLDASEAVLASAKAGIGIEGNFGTSCGERISAPQGDVEAPLKALIFGSVYDAYRGVILQIRVVDGSVKVGDTIR